MDRRPADPRVLRGSARFLQSLECGHGRRQYMHVVAGRGDNFAGRCPRRTLHALAAWRSSTGGARGRFRHGRPHQHTEVGRIASQDTVAGFVAREAGCAAPGFANQARPFRCIVDRDQRSGATGPAAHDHRRNPRPMQLWFDRIPSVEALRQTIDARIPADGYFADVHGSAAYKRHLTYQFAEQIRAELGRSGAGA